MVRNQIIAAPRGWKEVVALKGLAIVDLHPKFEPNRSNGWGDRAQNNAAPFLKMVFTGIVGSFYQKNVKIWVGTTRNTVSWRH